MLDYGELGLTDATLSTRFRHFREGGCCDSECRSLAAFVGGAWTAYSFHATKAAEKALVELELAKAKKAILDVQKLKANSSLVMIRAPTKQTRSASLHQNIRHDQEQWKYFDSEDMGNTFGPNGLSIGSSRHVSSSK